MYCSLANHKEIRPWSMRLLQVWNNSFRARTKIKRYRDTEKYERKKKISKITVIESDCFVGGFFWGGVSKFLKTNVNLKLKRLPNNKIAIFFRRDKPAF